LINTIFGVTNNEIEPKIIQIYNTLIIIIIVRVISLKEILMENILGSNF